MEAKAKDVNAKLDKPLAELISAGKSAGAGTKSDVPPAPWTKDFSQVMTRQQTLEYTVVPEKPWVRAYEPVRGNASDSERSVDCVVYNPTDTHPDAGTTIATAQSSNPKSE